MNCRIDGSRAYASRLGLESIDVEALLCAVLDRPRSYLYAWPEKRLTDAQWDKFLNFCERRACGEPVAYILGQREFWSLPLLTAPHTLIPRPDTEVLVEAVLEHYDRSEQRCLDLGTGTGAIALALKSERPQWKISGIDRVEAAVLLAEKNAAQLALEVSFSQSYWCDSVEDSSLNIIVSNPPYIDAGDHHLYEGDVRFEPVSALVADQQGLADIETIIVQAQRCLIPGGGLFLEHGWQQGADVRNLLSRHGYHRISTRRDYGGQERVTSAFKPAG